MAKKRSKAEQEEILNKPAKDVTESSPAARALLDDSFVGKSDLEATELTTLVSRLVRGIEVNNEELGRLRARMDAYDKATEEFNQNQEKFIQNVFDKAEKLRERGDAQDKLVAAGALQFEEAVKAARAQHSNARLKFEDELRTMPKETITSPGVWETPARQGSTPVLVAEQIKIKHKTWTLPPNTPVEVPRVVADRYRQIQQMRNENYQLQSALGAQMQDTKLAQKIKEINEKFGAGPDKFPIGSTA